MDSLDKFLALELPPQTAFYSSLSVSGISGSDYVHAQEIWHEFNCHNNGDYHDLYLYVNTLLMVSVFENFRKLCMSNYGLDSVHYYTTPGLS